MNKHNCSICGNGYKTQTKLARHLILCEFLCKAKQNNYKATGGGGGGGVGGGGGEEDAVVVPSQKVMYQLLLDLAQKYNRMEEKLEAVNQWVNRNKRAKPIDIVDWLNKNNKTPSYTFERLADQVRIEPSDVEHLMQHPFYDTIGLIFSRCLFGGSSSSSSSSSLPLFAFVRKSNQLYAYYDITSSWSELSRDKLVRFLNIVHKKISKAMFDWKHAHREEIGGNDHIASVFDKGVLKLMSINFNNDVTFGKMNSMLYSRLKTDI
jgi:hypothetical protein